MVGEEQKPPPPQIPLVSQAGTPGTNGSNFFSKNTCIISLQSHEIFLMNQYFMLYKTIAVNVSWKK